MNVSILIIVSLLIQWKHYQIKIRLVLRSSNQSMFSLQMLFLQISNLKSNSNVSWRNS